MTAKCKNRWLRRGFWFAGVVVVAGLALWKVPMFRHHPLCHARPADGQALAPGIVRSFWFGDAYAIEGRLADHYTEIFTSALERWGVPFVEIDGIVFFRLWDRITDPHDDIFNADQRTIRYLGDPEQAHPIWDEMPPDVLDRLLQIRREEIEAPHCEFVRTLVLSNWGRE